MSAHEEDQLQDPQLQEDDVVEIVEDDGEIPMDEDDDDNDKYDAEIIIGGPGPGEEDFMMDEEEDEGEQRADNSWGVNGKYCLAGYNVKPDD